MRGYCSSRCSGFPHSDIAGSRPVCGSPALIAAYHVLHRLLVPRHPPCAFCRLISILDLGVIPQLPRHKPQLSKNENRFACEVSYGRLQSVFPHASRSQVLTRHSRKEVIQPQVPLRLPCYDFAPVTDLTFDGSSLAVRPPASGPPSFHGVTGGVYKARERIHRGVADPRLLAIPASCRRVADDNPN